MGGGSASKKDLTEEQKMNLADEIISAWATKEA
jgi:hypothetical protein